MRFFVFILIRVQLLLPYSKGSMQAVFSIGEDINNTFLGVILWKRSFTWIIISN